MTPKVSIIIVNYNTRQLTADCIRSVHEKTSGISYEIILVDNASTDGSKELFECYPDITYIYSPENLGFGRANNLGAIHATGRHLLFLNSDTLLINNAVYVLSTYLDNNPQVGVCGGNLFDTNFHPTQSFRKLFPGIRWECTILMDSIVHIFTKKHTMFTEFNYLSSPMRVSYITGADLMINRDLFIQVGGFSKEFFMYYEETDLCHKIKKIGKLIMSVPEAKIQHLEGGSFSDSKTFNSARIDRIENGRLIYYYLNENRFVINISNFLHKTWMYLGYFLTQKQRYREHIKFMNTNNIKVRNQFLNRE